MRREEVMIDVIEIMIRTTGKIKITTMTIERKGAVEAMVGTMEEIITIVIMTVTGTEDIMGTTDEKFAMCIIIVMIVIVIMHLWSSIIIVNRDISITEITMFTMMFATVSTSRTRAEAG